MRRSRNKVICWDLGATTTVTSNVLVAATDDVRLNAGRARFCYNQGLLSGCWAKVPGSDPGPWTYIEQSGAAVAADDMVCWQTADRIYIAKVSLVPLSATGRRWTSVPMRWSRVSTRHSAQA